MSLAPPTPSLKPGHQLDRYELLALIAEGGMGQVWLARMVGKRGFEKLVAVKTLLPKFAADPKFQQMFLDEARIASGIEHANVAQILDLGEQNDVLYLVMELVDGEALSKLTRALVKSKLIGGGGQFPIPIGLRIIADTCAGIHVAHELRGPDGRELGIVHRDISPQNILITTTGVAKLIDFGIAKARDRFAGETSEGILKGKIHYMAPEQALGRKMDRRADVFALGAILYQLFTGRPAYDGESQLEILHLLTSGRPPLPLPTRVPRPVGDVIRKALATAPEDRFATALEMQRAINKAMTECGISADTSDVAAFAATHLVERTQKRRAAIELALKAAAERAAMNAALLQPTSVRTSPGTDLPFGAITPAPGSTSDVLMSPERTRSVSEVQAVAMRASEGDREATSVGAKRGGFARVFLVGVAALALAIGIAFAATHATRGSGTATFPVTTAGGNGAAAPLPSTTSTTTASRSAQESLAPSTAVAVETLPKAAVSAVSVAERPRTTPTGARTSTHVVPAATTTATGSAPKTTNVPDFGY